MLFLISSIAGIPAHPLLVHASVVLVPLSAIAVVIAGCRDRWRKHYLFPIAVLAVAAGVFSILAANTGETLRSSIGDAAQGAGAPRPDFGDHPQQGENARNFALLLALAVTAFWFIDAARRLASGTRRGGPLRLVAAAGDILPRWAPLGAYVVVLVPAVLAALGVIFAGHSGARLVWNDVGTYLVGK